MTTNFPDVPPLDEDAAGAIVDALVPALGIGMDPAWRPAVVLNLRATAAAASLVTDFTLDDELEPAPVFRA